MPRLCSLISLIIVCTLPRAQAETYSYPLKNIDSVEISAGIEFRIFCGDFEMLEIDAESDESFELSIVHNKLDLTRKGHWLSFFRKSGPVTATITLKKSPRVLDVSAGSHGDMAGCFADNSDLSVSLAAGSSIDINNSTGTIKMFDASLSSGSRLVLRGNLHLSRLDLDASSVADLEFDENVKIDSAIVDISSGASADICGAAKVDVTLSSGANVNVSANAAKKVKTSSGGEIDTRCPSF